MSDLPVESESNEGEMPGDPAVRVYCVVGLGNPGIRYDNTPHNIGFGVVDELAKRHGIRIVQNEGVARTGSGQISGRSVLLVKPQTFMNNSGGSVRSILKSHSLGNKDLVVVHDEIDLPWTGLRIRKKGSAAGHNGVRSLIAAINTDWFTRVRVGIHPNHEIEDAAVYVLAPWERALRDEVDEMAGYAADAIEFIIAEGAIKAMTKYNRRARGLQEEEE
jgi:peptidyl-tRNA hydrolase, PTH1 family